MASKTVTSVTPCPCCGVCGCCPDRCIPRRLCLTYTEHPDRVGGGDACLVGQYYVDYNPASGHWEWEGTTCGGVPTKIVVGCSPRGSGPPPAPVGAVFVTGVYFDGGYWNGQAALPDDDGGVPGVTLCSPIRSAGNYQYTFVGGTFGILLSTVTEGECPETAPPVPPPPPPPPPGTLQWYCGKCQYEDYPAYYEVYSAEYGSSPGTISCPIPEGAPPDLTFTTTFSGPYATEADAAAVCSLCPEPGATGVTWTDTTLGYGPLPLDWNGAAWAGTFTPFPDTDPGFTVNVTFSCADGTPGLTIEGCSEGFGCDGGFAATAATFAAGEATFTGDPSDAFTGHNYTVSWSPPSPPAPMVAARTATAPPEEGDGRPGSHLAATIEGWGLGGVRGCGGCSDVAAWMDRLGPDGCRLVLPREMILARLRDRAGKVGWGKKIAAGLKAAAAGLVLNPLDPAPQLLAEALRRADGPPG